MKRDAIASVRGLSPLCFVSLEGERCCEDRMARIDAFRFITTVRNVPFAFEVLDSMWREFFLALFVLKK
jgi:hypothetical protein